MENWFSTPNSETKTIESDGEVNNNVVIQGGLIDYGFEIMIINAVICALKIFELIIFCYMRHTQFVRKNHEKKLKVGSDIHKISKV